MVKYMVYQKLKKDFNNSSDLKYKEINNIRVVFLESICSSDKLNDYIFRGITLNKNYFFLRNIISGPMVVYITDYRLVKDYLLNGFALIYDDKDMLVCEVKGNLYRSVNEPLAEKSVNGPKDSFNESILMNLGLIKRRIRSEHLINEDYTLGRKTKNKVSLLYLDDVAKMKYVKKVKKSLERIDIDGIIDIEILSQILNPSINPLPTILKTERPDTVCSALLEGKIVLIADNSPYALIMPAFFVDFINPQSDKYVKSVNVNFLKIIRFLCFIVSITLPAMYISIVNYNPESIPINLLLSFQAGRSGVPFPSAFEAIFMILLCTILRESDIRFPSNYGSSISILGALILGEAAVAANVVSPIMIIIIGITFVTGLIFNNGDVIDGLRYYRFLLLFSAILFGLYGFFIGLFFIIVHLVSMNTLDEPYMFPIAPFEPIYLLKTFFRRNKETKRSKVLSNNINKVSK